jgi:acyl CoA:acetate/3-ketoacid CoA transferase beta subunit
MPMLAASFIPENVNVKLQSENGILGLVSVIVLGKFQNTTLFYCDVLLV